MTYFRVAIDYYAVLYSIVRIAYYIDSKNARPILRKTSGIYCSQRYRTILENGSSYIEK